MNRAEQIRYPMILTNLLLGVALSFFVLFPGTGGYERIQNGKFEMFSLLFGGYLILMALFTAEMALMRPPSTCAPVTWVFSKSVRLASR